MCHFLRIGSKTPEKVSWEKHTQIIMAAALYTHKKRVQFVPNITNVFISLLHEPFRQHVYIIKKGRFVDREGVHPYNAISLKINKKKL